MKRIFKDGWCEADKGKYFVLTKKGKEECASFKDKIVGQPIDEDETYAFKYYIDNNFLEEVDIPGWTKLIGYQVVYYKNGYRFTVGNPQIFPIRKAAEVYKNHYESYSWMKEHASIIEEVEYEGVPLKESQLYNGKEVIDKEHYFGLDCCEIGDYFTEEMINYFMDLLPPACMRTNCSQIGEPASHVLNVNDGNYYATYATFKQITKNIWQYCGECFRGENTQPKKLNGVE